MRSLISKVAITPDVFEDSLYEDPYRFRVGIANLLRGLEATGLVANMNCGEWLNFSQNIGKNRPEILKFLKLIIDRDRLIDIPATLKKEKFNNSDWVDESLLLLRNQQVEGVISTQASDLNESNALHPNELDAFGVQPSWWIDNPTEKLQTTVKCNVNEYIKVLQPILLHSRKIVFYDKFLDPSLDQFGNFHKILAICANNSKRKYLRIEIHRTIPHQSDPDFNMDANQWQERFSKFKKIVNTYNLNIEISIWNPRSLQHGKHPRFVLSKIGSFSFDKGFGEDRYEDNLILFMGKSESDRWERNFDKNVKQPKFSFRI